MAQNFHSFWFVIPAQGRLAVARVCFAQLRRTCDELRNDFNIHATAVIASNDENLDLASEFGFETVESSNDTLGRRINDGYEVAGKGGADYMAPLGNDDWVDPKWIGSYSLPADNEVRCAKMSAVVSEDGTKLARLNIPYRGGDGVRIFPRNMLQKVGFRPVEDERARAIDTSMFRRLGKELGKNPKVVYRDRHHLQIVDFKSDQSQLTTYESCCTFQTGAEVEPFSALAKYFPSESIAEMRNLYAAVV